MNMAQIGERRFFQLMGNVAANEERKMFARTFTVKHEQRAALPESSGELLDRRRIGASRKVMAMDAALEAKKAENPRSTKRDAVRPKKPPNPLAAKARNDIASAVKEFCSATGWSLGSSATKLLTSSTRPRT